MIVLKILFYIIVGLFLWFTLGHLSNVLLYLRRKITGLPINNSDPDKDDGKFKPLEVSYMCVGKRTKPENNDLVLSKLNMYIGPISLIIVIVSIFTHIIVPLIIWYVLVLFNYIFRIKDDGYKLVDFINKDIKDIEGDW